MDKIKSTYEYLTSIMKIALELEQYKGKNIGKLEITIQESIERKFEKIGGMLKELIKQGRVESNMHYKGAISMRDIVSHMYEDLNYDIITDTINNNLDDLIQSLDLDIKKLSA